MLLEIMDLGEVYVIVCVFEYVVGCIKFGVIVCIVVFVLLEEKCEGMFFCFGMVVDLVSGMIDVIFLLFNLDN